jgi:adenylate cyclase
VRDPATSPIREARRFLEQSISIDPRYARAYATLSRTHVRTYLEPLDSDYLNPNGLDRAHELAIKAVQVGADLPQAHSQLGWVLIFRRQHDASIAQFERAYALNPNFTDYQFGLSLVFAGNPARGIEVLQSSIRLDPFQPFLRSGYIGHAYYMLRRYAEAVPPLRECTSRTPSWRIAHLWLSAAYAQLGQLAQAHAEADEVRRLEPGFTIDRWKRTAPYKNSDDAEHLFAGLRRAGLPER